MSYKISVKRIGTCGECNAEIPIGSRAWWDPESRALTCLSHTAEELSTAPSTIALNVAELETPSQTVQDCGTAGGYAQAMHRKYQAKDQRKTDQENEIFKKKHPFLSKHFEIRATTSHNAKVWEKGALGGSEVGKILESLAAKHGFIPIHDRLIPKSKANIDHMVVTSSGIYVIDAKNYKGTIEVRGKLEKYLGGKSELWIGKRNRTALLEGVEKQVHAVEKALADAGETIPVIGVLSFVNAHWDLPTILRPATLNGILINSKGLSHIFEKLPPNDFDEVARIAELILNTFRPAS